MIDPVYYSGMRGTRGSDGHVQAVRSVRNAPWAPLGTVHRDTRHVRRCLRVLQTRGRCDFVAAEAFIDGPDPGARLRAVVSGWCPPPVMRLAEAYEEVADSIPGPSGWSTRSMAAPHATRHAFARSAADPGPGPDTGVAVARHRQAPVAVIEHFVVDEDARAEVAARADTSACVLTALTHDDSWLVSSTAAVNPKLPADVLERLTTGYLGMDDWATANPALSAEKIRTLVRDGSPDGYDQAAANPSCPPDVLRILADMDDFEINEDLAANPNTPPDLLEKLTQPDQGELTRIAAAANPSCPAAVLQHLVEHELRADHPDEEVLSAAAANPNLPTASMEELFEDAWTVAATRTAAATNPSCRDEMLQALANDPNPITRAAAATNPNIAASTLKQLTGDQDLQVRKTAVHGLHLRRRRTARH